MIFLLLTTSLSLYRDAILGYIGGYVVRKIQKNLSCVVCADALICNDNLNAYYLSLTHLKDNGGLIYPSKDVIKVIRMCELVFKGSICGDDYLNPGMSRAKKLKSVLRNKIFREVGDSAFCDICEHDFL